MRNTKARKIYLIRHGQSEGNLDHLVLKDTNIFKLTQEGRKQAESLVEILEEPKRIIVSKFIRTIETAQPIINKFPDSEIHLWADVHELHTVSLETTKKLETLEAYEQHTKVKYEELDVELRDPHADGHENFKEFVERVNYVILKMQKIPDGINYVFTHAYFIKMFFLLAQKYPDFDKSEKTLEKYKEIMQVFYVFKSEFKTANTQVFDVSELVENYNK